MPPLHISGADPGRLGAYARATAPTAAAVAAAGAELLASVEGWNRRPSAFGGRIEGRAVAAVVDAAAALARLDRWVGQVGEAFGRADRPSGPHPGSALGSALVVGGSRGGDAPGAAAPPAGGGGSARSPFSVVRSGRGGRSRVVRLDLDRPPDASPSSWARWSAQAGLLGGTGPVHLVVHGWGTTTEGAVGAGKATADLYDQQGVAATVVVVDWAAGEGTSGPWWRIPADFRRAEAASRAAGEALAAMLGPLASVDPDAAVAVSAHSLGNHVAARALSRMHDRSGRFSVDYLALQPAIPSRSPIDDPDHYGALVGARVSHLTVTVNDEDPALFWYEAQGSEALGDEAPGGSALATLSARRREAGLVTEVVDHDSVAGGGHLSLRPGLAQPLVRSLVQEAVDRADTGHLSAQGGIRRWIYRRWPERAEELLGHAEVRRYLDRQQRQGRPPEAAEVLHLVRQVLG